MDKKTQDWRKNGKHLPGFLRKFHDQKEFFKFLHEFTQIQDHELAKNINTIEGHAYSIDIFLWVLARFGWTLQRSQSKQDFDNLDEFVRQYTELRQKNFLQALLEKTTDDNDSISKDAP